MTYKELAKKILSMNEDQQGQDVTIGVAQSVGTEFYPMCDCVADWPKDQQEREQTVVADAAGVLDDDHPFLTITI